MVFSCFMCTALPWTPKVRQKDVDQFLDATRIKFVGFPLQNDRVSLAGLPQPIHEGVRVLKQVAPFFRVWPKRIESCNSNFVLPIDRFFLLFCFFFLAEQHMYMSLSEIQIQHEEDITRNPVSKGNEEIALTPTEILYQVRDTRAVGDAVSFQFTSPFLSISFEFQIETKFQRFFLNFIEDSVTLKLNFNKIICLNRFQTDLNTFKDFQCPRKVFRFVLN